MSDDGGGGGGGPKTVGPAEFLGAACPGGSRFYACDGSAVRFVGCCSADPCGPDAARNSGCPQDELRPATYNRTLHTRIGPQACADKADAAVKWYTCSFEGFDLAPFYGCCTVNPCQELGCPAAALRQAVLSDTKEGAAPFLPRPVSSPSSASSSSASSSSSPSSTSSSSSAASTSAARSTSASTLPSPPSSSPSPPPRAPAAAADAVSKTVVVGISLGTSLGVVALLLALFWLWRRAAARKKRAAAAAAAAASAPPPPGGDAPAPAAHNGLSPGSPASYPSMSAAHSPGTPGQSPGAANGHGVLPSSWGSFPRASTSPPAVKTDFDGHHGHHHHHSYVSEMAANTYPSTGQVLPVELETGDSVMRRG